MATSEVKTEAKRNVPTFPRGRTSQQIPDGDKTTPTLPTSLQTTLPSRGTPFLHSSEAASLPSKFIFNSTTKVLTRVPSISGNNSFKSFTQPLLPSPPLSLATINFLNLYFASLHSSAPHRSFALCNKLVQKLVDSLFVRTAPTSPPSSDWIRVFSKKRKKLSQSS